MIHQRGSAGPCIIRRGDWLYSTKHWQQLCNLDMYLHVLDFLWERLALIGGFVWVMNCLKHLLESAKIKQGNKYNFNHVEMQTTCNAQKGI